MAKKFNWMGVFVIACSILSVIAGHAQQAEGEFSDVTVVNPDTLTILAYGEPDQLDPASCYDARGALVIQNLYDRLVGYDSSETTVISPRLAKKWTMSADGTEYTFYLREDATFHDGTLVTAHAVKYSFDRVMKINQSPAWMMTQFIDSTEIIDDYTVKIILRKPYAGFLSILCKTVASIVNPDVVETHGSVRENKKNEWLDLNEGGAGSGPYELVEWIPDERIVLKRYDNYWRGPANTENVRILFISDIGDRVTYIKKGDADIATGFPEDNIQDVLGAEGVTVLTSPSCDITFIVLGCRGVLADKKVRQALCMATDYDTILESVYMGYASRLYSPIPKGMFGWHHIEPYNYDINGANALLDGEGYTMGTGDYRIDPSTGNPLGAEIAVPSGDKVRSRIASLLKSSLRKIGFNLEIREVAMSKMYTLIRNGETDMITTGWLPDYGDPDNYVDSLCNSINAKVIWGSDYRNRELDALIDQANSELDKTAREDLYYKILLIVKEDAPFVWLAQTGHTDVMRTWVKGYFYNPVQPMEFGRMYKGEETTPVEPGASEESGEIEEQLPEESGTPEEPGEIEEQLPEESGTPEETKPVEPGTPEEPGEIEEQLPEESEQDSLLAYLILIALVGMFAALRVRSMHKSER
ncbi:MAG: hypothetical protein HXS54_01860 [Theionarchaea archaeon]|nr:hypothetical protein [Theionarchaea archaeon]